MEADKSWKSMAQFCILIDKMLVTHIVFNCVCFFFFLVLTYKEY